MKSNLFKLISIAGFCALLSGMVVCAADPYQEPQGQAAQEPQSQEAMVAEGELLEVDLDAHTLTIQQQDSTKLVIHFNESTKVTGAEGVQGLANNAGTPIAVTYRVDENDRNIATSIELKQPDTF